LAAGGAEVDYPHKGENKREKEKSKTLGNWPPKTTERQTFFDKKKKETGQNAGDWKNATTEEHGERVSRT